MPTEILDQSPPDAHTLSDDHDLMRIGHRQVRGELEESRSEMAEVRGSIDRHNPRRTWQSRCCGERNRTTETHPKNKGRRFVASTEKTGSRRKIIDL